MTQEIADSGAVVPMSNTTHYVLDTNVLLHNENSVKNFGNNTVVIPMQVLKELDQFKVGLDPIHFNARDVVRFLDTLRSHNSTGALKNGVPREHGGFLRIINDQDFVKDFPALDMNDPDNKIISVAYQLMKNGKDVVFVSKDINARLRADFLGIPVQDFERQVVISSELFSGQQSLSVPKDLIDEVFKIGSIDLPAGVFMPNEFVILVDDSDHKHTAITRVMGGNKLVNICPDNQRAFGIMGRNKEQRMTLDLLLEPVVSMVTLIGPAGTGKTIMAVAAALHQVKILKRYEKVVYSRAIIPMGKDIGYLPGTKDEKIAPWMQAFSDSLAIICMEKNPDGKFDTSNTPEALMSSGLIELTALTYVRGRSMPKQIIIVDEVQNLTPHEVKSIASRAGEGSKIVLMGDPDQIDNPYLDKRTNGLSYAVQCMKHNGLHGHVTLTKTVRSDLAQAVVDCMK